MIQKTLSKLVLFASLLLPCLAFGQTVTVTADLKSMFGAAQATKTKVCFTLTDGSGATLTDPRVIGGSGVIVPTQTQCVTPDANGHVSTSIYANDQISSSSGPAGSSLYTVEYYFNGLAVHSDQFLFKLSDVTENLNSKVPITIPPLIAAPAGDSTYLRLDGGNVATGPIAHNPSSNGVDVLSSTRFTDTLPTGNFLNFKSLAGVTLFKVDINGNITTPSATITGAIVLGGPSPWIDITSPIYGAKCDGVTDDTVAFNAAIAAAQFGGTVFVPYKTCVIAGQLVVKQSQGVTIKGTGGLTNNGLKPLLVFTGSTSPLVDARSIVDFKMSGIAMKATNTALASAKFWDFSHAPSGFFTGDSVRVKFEDVWINGPNATSISCLFCPTNTDLFKLDKVTMDGAVNAVTFATTCGAVIEDSYFNSGATMTTAAAIANTGTPVSCQLTIGPGDFFEGFSWSNTAAAFDGGSLTQPVLWIGNTVGDIPAGYSGTEFKNVGSHFTMIGSTTAGGTSNLATAMSVASAADHFTIISNEFINFATMFAFGGVGPTDVNITSNGVGSITTFSTGTVPTSGIYQNPIGGANTVNVGPGITTGSAGISINGGTALTGQVGTGTSVATNTSVQSFQFGCSGTAAASNTIIMSSPSRTDACTITAATRPLGKATSAGVGKNLFVACATGGVNASSGVVTVQDGGAGTALTCTLGTGLTCSDTTHSFTIAAGDDLDIKMTTQAAETIAGCAFAFEKQ